MRLPCRLIKKTLTAPIEACYRNLPSLPGEGHDEGSRTKGSDSSRTKGDDSSLASEGEPTERGGTREGGNARNVGEG